MSRCRRSIYFKLMVAAVALILAGILFFALLLGMVFAGNRDQISGEPEIMIILGCQVKPWGPSILLQDRLDKALEYLDGRNEIMIVVSGGQGPDEHISEAQAMFDYLTANGVEPRRIIMEDQSFNTFQNLTYSIKMLKEQGFDVKNDVVVVSNGFHLTRVRMLWNRINGSDHNLSLLAAPSSHAPSRLKMYIREPIGLVKSFIFDR